jgi:Acetyl-coenzyme A transporter 1
MVRGGAGASPFLLQANASYTQIGIFSVASYPYSFKLLWSPIVDSLYSSTIGRRKTWIVRALLPLATLLCWMDAVGLDSTGLGSMGLDYPLFTLFELWG